MFIISLISACSTSGAFSGIDRSNISSVKIKLPTVQCGMCQQTITDGLMTADGVHTAYVNLNEEKVLVEYDKSKISINELNQTIAKLGYQAGDKPANSDAYNNLQDCCKLPEDR